MPRLTDLSERPALQDLKERIGHVLDHFYDKIGRHHHAISGHVAGDFEPPADVSGSDIGLRITMELPGMEARDVEVLVRGGALTIRGEKEEERSGKGRTHVFRERVYGRFSRSIALTDDLDVDRTDATFRDGVLTISVPIRSKAKRKAKKIKVLS